MQAPNILDLSKVRKRSPIKKQKTYTKDFNNFYSTQQAQGLNSHRWPKGKENPKLNL